MRLKFSVGGLIEQSSKGLTDERSIPIYYRYPVELLLGDNDRTDLSVQVSHCNSYHKTQVSSQGISVISAEL